MLFGKAKRVVKAISAQFESREVKKEYLALVAPKAPRSQWAVKGNQLLSLHPSGAKHSFFEFESTDTSERALLPCVATLSDNIKKQLGHTDFEVLDTSDRFSLVRAYPITGRTHQIRLHLAASACPIVGDWLYGPEQDAVFDEQFVSRSSNQSIGKGFFSSHRLQLHAHAVTLLIDGKPTRIVAEPLSSDGWLASKLFSNSAFSYK